MDTLTLWVYCFICLLFFCIGLVCLFFPYSFQKYMIKDLARKSKSGQSIPFLVDIKSKSYIIYLRFVGPLLILHSLISLYLLLHYSQDNQEQRSILSFNFAFDFRFHYALLSSARTPKPKRSCPLQSWRRRNNKTFSNPSKCILQSKLSLCRSLPSTAIGGALYVDKSHG